MPGQHPEEDGASADSPQGELGRSRALDEGAQFASYVITGLLGSGGLARVYRARHQTLGHEVALKIFEPAAAAGPTGLTRFVREAQLAASIHHPHVVQTHDGGVHEGMPYVVMELLEGRDLEAHLRAEHTLEELALIELAIPIVSALMALHARGVVHGDLGPGNVFLVQPSSAAPQQRSDVPRPSMMGPDVPRLLDIGISKPHRQLRLTAAARQRLMGSPLYMAPEAMLGHELTPASDQYSLGLILYECVTGVNPFVATSLKESVRLIIAGQRLPVLEQSVRPSPGLAAIIERTLSVDPAERFPDLAALGRALLQLADQRTRAAWEFSFQAEPAVPPAPVSAARSAPTVRLPRPSRWGLPAVALSALGWITAGIVSFSSTRPDPEQAYVMLGPPPRAQLLPGQLAAAPPVAATALVPCPEASADDLRTDGLVPLEAGGAGSAADGENAGAADGDGLVVAGEVAAGLPYPEGTLQEGSAPALEGAPAAGGQGFDLQLAAPAEALRANGATLPVRGTNNAPIFD